MSRPAKTRLSGIEAVRGCAATAVVLYHAARHLNWVLGTPQLMRAVQFGHAGVDLFFVVSGFIILFVHHRDVGEPSRSRHYLARRFSRVMPTYWVALGLTLLISLAAGHAVPPVARLLWSVTLLPSVEEPILGIAWTLQYEIVFYAAFSVLIISRRAGLALSGVWLGWILVVWLGWGAVAAISGNAGIPSSLYDPYNLEFFMGMAGAYWLRRRTVPKPRLFLAVGLAVLILTAAAEDAGYLDGYAAPARLAYGIPSALLILGVAEAERCGRLTIPAGLRLLGGASYSIYLFQFVFIGVAWNLWLAAGLDGRTPAWASYPLLVCAGLAGGMAMARLVERPLLRLVRSERPKPAAYPV